MTLTYQWSKGKAIFTSGSPFAVVEHEGKLHRPGQGNNAYVFPGIGLGAIACNAKKINDAMFLASAQALADLVSQDDLDAGTLYPPLSEIRNVSLAIAVAVAEKAWEHGLARGLRPADLKQKISGLMYHPDY